MAQSLKETCSNHGESKVAGQTKLGAVTHVMLECGCTLEKIDDDYVKAGDAVLHNEELWRVDEVEDHMVSLRNVNGSAVVPIDLVTFIAKDTLSGTKKSEIKVSIGAVVRHVSSRLTGVVERDGDLGNWVVRVAGRSGELDKKFAWRESELEVLRPGYKVLKSSSTGSAWYKEQHPRRQNYSSSSHTYQERREVKPRPKKSHSISTADLIKEEVNDLRKEDTPFVPPTSKPSQKSSVDLDDEEKVKPKKRKGVW